MSGALCIDFGTSSLRAVRRQPIGKLKPLAIGRVTRSRLDDASIRSEIHVDAAGKQVRFGDAAVRQSAKQEGAMLYELSPKMWLRDPNSITQPIAGGMELTREELLIGLLANAIHACADADNIGYETLRKLDLRIAHPVWETAQGAANTLLLRIASKAKLLALRRDWSSVPVSALREWVAQDTTERISAVDVVEPIAAAVELLPYEENLIRLCAIIDVGAGTTDVGLFKSLVPDPDSCKRDRLIPCGAARSVFKAGNEVDRIVLEQLARRSSVTDEVRWTDVRGRIRRIKETLFQRGYAQELGVDLQLEDVEGHPNAKAMASAIRAQVIAAVTECQADIQLLMNRSSWPVQELDVVLAGGGAQMGFLRRALAPALEVGGRTLRVRITDPQERAGAETFGAGRGRMAVALGGASVEYDHLQTLDAKIDKIRRGKY